MRKMPPVVRSGGAPADEPPLTAPARAPEPAPAPGFLKGLLRRNDAMPPPEMVAPGVAPDADAPPEDRVRARISDAIRARMTSAPEPEAEPDGWRIEPSLTAGKGPRPLLLNTAPGWSR